MQIMEKKIEKLSSEIGILSGEKTLSIQSKNFGK
jgi:hypothetical protein